MKFRSDIDIDFGDRSRILSVIKHIPASIDLNTAHNTGIYPTEIPVNPFTGTASIDYRTAEQRGYIKLDFLNVHIYNQISSEQELDVLLNTTPPWHRLLDSEFCQKIIHIGNHYNTLLKMPEPVDSIPRLAMFLAVIRPAKRYLIGKTWQDVSKEIWQRPADDSYYFKKAHAVSYAHLCLVHMNLINLTN